MWCSRSKPGVTLIQTGSTGSKEIWLASAECDRQNIRQSPSRLFFFWRESPSQTFSGGSFPNGYVKLIPSVLVTFHQVFQLNKHSGSWKDAPLQSSHQHELWKSLMPKAMTVSLAWSCSHQLVSLFYRHWLVEPGLAKGTKKWKLRVTGKQSTHTQVGFQPSHQPGGAALCVTSWSMAVCLYWFHPLRARISTAVWWQVTGIFQSSSGIIAK